MAPSRTAIDDRERDARARRIDRRGWHCDHPERAPCRATRTRVVVAPSARLATRRGHAQPGVHHVPDIRPDSRLACLACVSRRHDQGPRAWRVRRARRHDAAPRARGDTGGVLGAPPVRRRPIRDDAAQPECRRHRVRVEQCLCRPRGLHESLGAAICAQGPDRGSAGPNS